MLKKRTGEKGNNKKSSEEGSDCLIKREEIEWALDCVQTRNCRVDLNMISSLNKNGKENIVERVLQAATPYGYLLLKMDGLT